MLARHDRAPGDLRSDQAAATDGESVPLQIDRSGSPEAGLGVDRQIPVESLSTGTHNARSVRRR